MIRTILFDFDGTIADTLNTVIVAYNSIASKYDLETINSEQKEFLRNFGARELIKKYKVSPWKLFFLTRTMRLLLKSQVENIAFFPGMDELFKELQQKGIVIGIVTSNSKEKVEACLKRWNITAVDFIHSERNIFSKAKAFRHVLKQYQIKKDEVMYIGDEVRDIEATKEVGIPIIAVTWGFNSEERLAESHPKYLAYKPSDILTILK
jgi:phosphoglycolate phosphatase